MERGICGRLEVWKNWRDNGSCLMIDGGGIIWVW